MNMNMKMPGTTSRRAALLRLAAAGGALLAPTLALAQDTFPNKTIKFIVPFGPGSSNDITARVYAKVIGDITRQSIVVENKAGGDGVIGARALLSEPADGYAVLFASNSLLATNAVVRKDLPYDPLKDFDPISTLEASYAALAVPATSKFHTFDDFAKFAKANPGTLNHASGTPMYTLWNQWLMDTIGAKATNVPYKDSGGVVRALGGGEVDYAIVAVNALAPILNSGRIRVLLYTGAKRHPLMPNAPVPAEVGLKDYEARIWTAAAVRAGTPKPVRDKLESLFESASKSDVVQDRMKAQGHTPIFSGAEGMRKFQASEVTRWRKLVADTGIKSE